MHDLHDGPSHYGVGREPPPQIDNIPLILGLISSTSATGRSPAHMDVGVLMVKPQH